MAGDLKGLMIILDGLGDIPAPALGGATPLEAAHTPNLDRLVAEGQCGLVDPLHPGLPVSTQIGVGALMGFAPADLMRLTRGPVEAAGIGLQLRPGDIAIRCNFATLQAEAGHLRILDRRAGRIREGTADLADALTDILLEHRVSTAIRPATQHRAVLRLSGPGLSEDIGDTDPGSLQVSPYLFPCRPLDPHDARSIRTAAILNDFLELAHELLSDHPINRERERRGEPPANGLITRGAGTAHSVQGIVQHLGMTAAVVAAEATVLGLGRLLGFTALTDPAFTAGADTDLSAKIATAREALRGHDLVFVHIKAPDILAHDLDPIAKRDFIAEFDRSLAAVAEENIAIAVSADHSTDSRNGRHSGAPVPSLLHIPGGRRDLTEGFGEQQCMTGGIGRISASALLLSLLDGMGAIFNFEPADRRFLWPS